MGQHVSVSFDGACRLHAWSVIRAQGDDAARFLHAQLSNDIEKLPPGQARLAAYCTPQGRMLASFVVVRHAADDLWLACSADVLPATLKRLSMFVLRAKASLSDAGHALAVVGLAGPTAQAAAGGAWPASVWGACTVGDAEIVRLHDVQGCIRALWMGPVAASAALLGSASPLNQAHWDWLEVMSGVPRIAAGTAGAFVPQMVNFELVGGVDFKKGCYPGQEIVARSQYLGKLKRRSLMLHGAAAMRAGDEVFWSGDTAQPAGQVVLSAVNPSAGFDAIVELKTLAWDEGSLHLGSTQGQLLEPLPLPYTLPGETGAR